MLVVYGNVLVDFDQLLIGWLGSLLKLYLLNAVIVLAKTIHLVDEIL